MANRVVNLELHSDYCGNCAVCAGRQVGVNDERERIIKLLEQDMQHAFGNDGKCIYEKHYREVCNCDIIALIKGENNG